MDNYVEILEQNTAALDALLDTVESLPSFGSYSNDLAEVRAENANLNNQISDLNDEIDDLKTEIDRLKDQITCVRGDTQILMADGTTKDIKDVKYGDMIKSYDVENKCLVDVKSYGSYCTGYEQFWNLAGFTNGTTLYIGSNGHYIFHPYEERLRKSNLYPIKGKVYTSNGETPVLVGRGVYNAMVVEERYELLSENGLYFANDILVGHMIDTTYHHYVKGEVPLTAEEAAEVLEDIEVYKNYKADGLNNPEFLREAGKVLVEVNKRTEHVEKNKKRLADLDYKQVKRAQGKLSDEDYDKYLADCDKYRTEINEDEVKISEDSVMLEALREKHGIRGLKFKDDFLMTHHKQMERIRRRSN